MNIFLDTNILYKDPFFQRGKLIVLRELAKCSEVNIYINEAVLEEIRRGYIEYVESNIRALEKAKNNLNKNIINPCENLISSYSLEKFIEQFDKQILDLKTEGILTVTPYYKKVVEKIVKIDMYRSSPFIKDNVKFAVRDAIIWYSYVEYIKDSSLTNCYFISNNTKEFAECHKESQQNDSNSYQLSHLLEDIPFDTAHKSANDFIKYYEENIQEIFERNDADIINENQLVQISSLFRESNSINLLENDILTLVENAIETDLDNTSPMELVEYYRPVDYIDGSFTEGELISNMEIKDVSSYGSRIIVEVEFEFLKDVDLYLYNSVRDTEDERYSYCGNIPIIYNIKATLTWGIINHLYLLENERFDLDNIINIKDVEDISIDILSSEYQQDEYFDDGLDLNY